MLSSCLIIYIPSIQKYLTLNSGTTLWNFCQQSRQQRLNAKLLFSHTHCLACQHMYAYVRTYSYVCTVYQQHINISQSLCSTFFSIFFSVFIRLLSSIIRQTASQRSAGRSSIGLYWPGRMIVL